MRSPADTLRQPFLAAILALALGCAAPEAGTDDAMAEAEPAAAEVAEMPPQPMADPADVESIDAIITAVYEVNLGGRGRPTRLGPVPVALPPPGKADARQQPARRERPQQFGVAPHHSRRIHRGQRKRLRSSSEGFYEVEIGSVTEQYGDIAHRFSSYASFRTDDPDEEPFNRGINSFQLLYDGERWWVLSIFWQHEPDAGPIPAEYLDEV